MVSVQITFHNTSDKTIEDIHIEERKTDLKMHIFNPIGKEILIYFSVALAL